jgi:DNA repair exonuclease SbcCD ATPase subunit
MIIFKTLAWKNFLSTGNNLSKIDFTAHKSTLVIGHNGAGKSTMLDALSFALFGKAHRNISKPQLVNSINNKDCLVEVEFTVHGSEYLIRRGIKPNIFEIMHNGVLLNQSSHAKEYQKILEQNILKLNHKSFHQIVVLGSSSFIPFMQLSAQNRRDVIEDLLDINVFSKMNSILKEKTSLLKDQIKDVTHQHALTSTKIDAQKKYIKDVKAINTEQKEAKLQLIEDCRHEIEALHGKNKKLSDSIQSQLPNADVERGQQEAKIKSLEAYKTKFNTEVQKIVKEVQFFEKNDICPTCDQTISNETKETHVLEGKSRAKELQKGLSKADEGLREVQEALSSTLNIIDQCRGYQSDLAANNQSISQFQSSIDRTQKEISGLDQNVDMDAANEELQQLVDTSNSLVEQKLVLNEQTNYNIVIGEMLKDTGIKTKIVKEYLPVINMLVNKYLQTLDFFVSFNLNEAFQETIRSRHRDNFSYESFSEGEKQRIDLSLLFTWRHIAKMKNSVATNLLILDETFDSSLDHEGVDNLMKIIYSLDDDTNVFVISHKGEMVENRFAHKIEIYKDKNFSRIK